MLCTDLLADPAPVARVGAIRAPTATGRSRRDRAPSALGAARRAQRDLLGEAPPGLVQLDPARGVDVVRPLLASRG